MRRVGPAWNGVIRPVDMSRFIVMLRRGLGGNTRRDHYACDQDGSGKRQHGLDSLSVCARSRQAGPKDQPQRGGGSSGPKRPAQLRSRFAICRIPLNSALEQQAYPPACRAGAKGEALTRRPPMSDFLKKTAILLSTATVCAAIGLAVPLMFDRDVGGALASALLAIVGLIVGGIIGAIIIKRAFD